MQTKIEIESYINYFCFIVNPETFTIKIILLHL